MGIAEYLHKMQNYWKPLEALIIRLIGNYYYYYFLNKTQLYWENTRKLERLLFGCNPAYLERWFRLCQAWASTVWTQFKPSKEISLSSEEHNSSEKKRAQPCMFSNNCLSTRFSSIAVLLIILLWRAQNWGIVNEVLHFHWLPLWTARHCWKARRKVRLSY